MRFPINLQYNRGIPINNHPGAFGCRRKYDVHTGVDLYGKPGDYVYAIKDGIVVDVDIFTGDSTTEWWLPTDAITIESDTENYVYGELEPLVKIGERICKGQVIGKLKPVLKPEKLRSDIPKHSCTMLHLEKYSRDYEPDKGWAVWYDNSWYDTKTNRYREGGRPKYLLDPTNDLIDILVKNHRRIELLTL